MAKSEKPIEATDKGEQGVDAPENAEQIPAADDPDLIGADKVEDPVSAESESDIPDVADSLEEILEPLQDASHELEDIVESDEQEISEAEEALDETDAIKDAVDEIPEAEGFGENDDIDGLDAEPEQFGGDADSGETVAKEATDIDIDTNDETATASDILDVEDAKPEPAAAVKQEPPVQVVKGSVWPAFFGGVIAALIAFIIGRGDIINEYLPASMQRKTVDISAIEAKTAALESQAAETQIQLEAESAAQDVRIGALEAVDSSSVLAAIAALETDIETIAARLAELETRPVAEAVEPGAPVEAVEELQAALDLQKAQISALSERAEAAEASAADEAARILARAALMRVMTAVDSGETFDTALTDLEDVTPVEVPQSLREAAENGVPTLAALQAGFPDAARAGLAAARAEVPESEVVGITGFLKRQLNVRSITPREGDDPDAVLSRVDAAVSNGDLTTALMEVEKLPNVAREAMSDWLQAATARKAAQDATGTLADSLNSN